MDIMKKVFKSLLPKGDPWKHPGYFKSLVEAVAQSFTTLRTFLKSVIAESNPSTANETIEEWFDMLGLYYDATQPLDNLRKRAKQAYTATGGSSKEYLEEQIQKAYPDVRVGEVFMPEAYVCGVAVTGLARTTDYPSWLPSPPTDGSTTSFYYLIRGTVETVQDLDDLTNLLQRIAPLTHTPVFLVEILQQQDSAQCGLAITGLAEVGKEEGE